MAESFNSVLNSLEKFQSDALEKQQTDLDVAHAKNGNGLGFSSALEMVDSWGGSILVESTLGKGTDVAIRLPVAKAPLWFADKVSLKPNHLVLCLDDDPSAANIWKARMSQRRMRHAGIEFRSYDNRSDLVRARDGAGKRKVFCLIDHELAAGEGSGASLIIESAMQRNSYLVTNYYEDRQLQECCLKMDIKMLPKILVSRVAIEIDSVATQRELQ